MDGWDEEDMKCNEANVHSRVALVFKVFWWIIRNIELLELLNTLIGFCLVEFWNSW